MADIKENEMIERAVAFLRCIDSGGNSGVVKIASLLSLLINLFRRNWLNGDSDYNNIYTSGLYSISPENGIPANSPSGIELRGLLLVLSDNEYHTIQVVLSTKNKIAYRGSFRIGEPTAWSEWRII